MMAAATSPCQPVSMRVIIVAVCGVLLVGCGGNDEPDEPSLDPEPMTVMTFNVMCSLCGTSEHDPWEERLEYFRDIFARHDPDLVGIQELTPLGDEVGQLLERLPGRAAVYFAPADELPYPDAAIFYRKSRFRLLDSGEYWLSPTPDEPRSTGFAKPQLARLVVWATLRDRAGDRDFYFATTHFDNNVPSQALSAPLVKERTAPFAGKMPVIVTGDFNSKPGTEAWATLTTDSGGFPLADTHALAEQWRVISTQQPEPSYELESRIDHVFVGGTPGTWAVSDWNVDMSRYGPQDRRPSDHFPITTRLDYW